MPGLPPSARQVTQYPAGVPTGVGGGNAGASLGSTRIGQRTPRMEPMAPMGNSQRSMGGGMAMPPPTPRVRPGDPATALMRQSGPMIVAPDDRNFRHQQAQYGDGVASGDWRTGFGMPEDLSTVGGGQNWRAAFNPNMNLAPPGLEKLNGGDQTNPALAKTIRGDAADMGDLAGTDLGAQLQGYMHEQANRLDPFGGGTLDRQTLQAAFGSPNMLSGATGQQEADDAGDVGVPKGFQAPDGSTWNGTSWQQKGSGSIDDTTANPVGMSGFKSSDPIAAGDFQVKPMKGSPWGSADNLWNAFRGAAGGQD